jgi:parallel beta-helix repeat protein
MRRLIHAILLFTVFLAPAWADKRVALVIGNSKYQNVTPLTNPANDAVLMEAALKDAGFDVTLLKDLDQKGMKQAMLNFGRKLKQGADASMFFYAGHGIEVDGKNYLVPVDSNTENKEEADIQNIEVNDFLALMENSGVPLNIVVLDACRNNPFRSMRSVGGGLAPVLAPAGTYVAYSTAAGSVAADGAGANSPFTESLAESLRIPGLTLEGVFKKTRSKVRSLTNGAQVPFDSSAIEGDFYFVNAPPPPVVIAAPPPPVVVAPPPVVTIPEPVVVDDGKEAYAAAGNDPIMLQIVANAYKDSIWGQLAEIRLRSLEAQVAVATPAPAPVEPAPVREVAPEPDPAPVASAAQLAPPPAAPADDGIVVAADGTGDYTSIADAVAAANDGDKISVAAGEYSGGVVVTKAIEIIGPDDAKKVVWSVSGSHVINWQAKGGKIANMTLHQTGGCETVCSAVFIDNASPQVENNFVTSDAGSAIVVTGPTARPDIVNNTISKSKESGIYLDVQGGGTITGNDIFDNGLAGIEIASGADPLVKNNAIRDGRSGGILVGVGGLGTIENNDVYNNALSGIETTTKGKVVVRSNKIYKNKQAGLFIQSSDAGVFNNNEIKGNIFSGIEITNGGRATFDHNTVTENVENGFYIHGGAGATLTSNDVSGNTKGAFLIEKDAGKVKRSGNKE